MILCISVVLAVSSLTFDFIYLGPLSFFFSVSLTKVLFILFTFFKEAALSFIDLFCFSLSLYLIPL